MTCEEFEELSGAYALGAVTPEERHAAREHLATCAKCMHLEQQLHAIVDLLPLSVTQVTPAADLKERVLDAVQQEQGNRVIPIDRPARNRQRWKKLGWGSRLLAIAAIVLLMLTGAFTAWNISLQQHVTTLQQQNTRLGGQIGALQREVAQVYTVKGTQAQAVNGSLVYIPQKNVTLLVLYGLPVLKGSQLYQGWLIHANQTTSIGKLTIQNGVASLAFTGNVSGYQQAAVSQEPGPNPTANAPNGSIIAIGALQHPVQTFYTI